jgi:hypothetical protein
MSSFRAGAYSLLLALTFLSYYVEFFQIQVSPKICLILASDQHKIANRIIQHLQCTISCPRYIGNADQDIIVELAKCLDSSPHFIDQPCSAKDCHP